MKKFDLIILSGGKGTRVSRYTKKIPKCLIKINGQPFLFHQLKYLLKNNIKNIIICTGYLNNQINLYLKKNISNINVKTLSDGNTPLGTGGAIINALKFMKKNFFILYGDSFLNFDLNLLRNNNNLATMAIYKNKNRYDKSNIKLLGLKKIKYYKANHKKNLIYIDYGVSYLNKQVFKEFLKKKKFQLPDFFENISSKNMLNGFIVKKRFYEIGSYSGIKEAKKFLKK